jgi:hypothetical protein
VRLVQTELLRLQVQLYVMAGSDVDGADGAFDCDGRVRDLEEM